MVLFRQSVRVRKLCASVLGTYLVITLVSSKPTRLLNPKITCDIKDQKLFRITAEKKD